LNDKNNVLYSFGCVSKESKYKYFIVVGTGLNPSLQHLCSVLLAKVYCFLQYIKLAILKREFEYAASQVLLILQEYIFLFKQSPILKDFLTVSVGKMFMT
jgi:hypothetical protein